MIREAYQIYRLDLLVVRNIPLLVATDLDGTIVPHDGTISPRTIAAFARVEQAGGRFVLVTGRPPRVMSEIAEVFGNTGTAICANGALAYDMRTGMVEARHLIPPEDIAAATHVIGSCTDDGVAAFLERLYSADG